MTKGSSIALGSGACADTRVLHNKPLATNSAFLNLPALPEGECIKDIKILLLLNSSIKGYFAYFFNQFPVCFNGPQQHHKEEKAKDEQRAKTVDAYAADLFEVMNKFHVLFFKQGEPP